MTNAFFYAGRTGELSVIPVIINKEAGSLTLLRGFELTLLLQGRKHTVIDTGGFFENRIGFTLRFCPVFGIRDTRVLPDQMSDQAPGVSVPHNPGGT